MIIEWYGHSCFKISIEDFSICLDPFNPEMIPGIDKLDVSANLVLCSHEHADHNYRKAVKIIDKPLPKGLNISFIESYHDNEHGTKRGKNLITVIENKHIKIVHLGDLGTMLDDNQIERLKNLDAIMIPIGGHYTIGPLIAKQICKTLNPKIIIPMHYRSETFGFNVLSKINDFLKLFDELKVVAYKTNKLDLAKEKHNHIALLELL
jgi:L-ascorbate metabolism protein UlaG (beta-lactamase superfamily)